MGKASRRKRERASGDENETRELDYREVAKRDRRGRKVGSTLTEYEELCVHGPDRVAEALIARYTKRMDRVRLTSDYDRLPIMEAFASASALDIILYRGGKADANRPPQHYWGSWPDRLGWGVDSCAAAIRLLLCGQVVGAAVVARTQLERWTFLRAQVAGLKQESGEDTIDYIARAWSTPDDFDAAVLGIDAETSFAPTTRTTFDEGGPAHDHIVMSDGYEACPPLFWSWLSEFIHGRELPEALAWDSTAMLDNEGWNEDYALAVGLVCETLRLCLRQLRTTAANLVEKAGDHKHAAILLASLDGFSSPDEDHEGTRQLSKALWRKRIGQGPDAEVPEEEIWAPPGPPNEPRSPSAIMFRGLTTPPLSALMPFTPNEGMTPGVVAELQDMAIKFAKVIGGGRPEGRLYRDDELATLAFGWHRARSVRVALLAMEAERRHLGDDFNIDSLTGRATAWTLTTEAASVVAGWLERQEMRNAAYLVGSGLRSASWMWLEDDDRAMSILRTTLEQAARLRTWRQKPERAAKLEAKGARTTPHRWLEAAGWGRLSALNRALGEFAHAMPRSDWSGARDLLSLLQDTDVDPDKAIYTARGAALELVTDIVVDEITTIVRDMSPTLADTLVKMYANVGIELPLDAEARFNHIWAHRRTKTDGARQFSFAPGVVPPGSAILAKRSTSTTNSDLVRRSIAGIVPSPGQVLWPSGRVARGG